MTYIGGWYGLPMLRPIFDFMKLQCLRNREKQKGWFPSGYMYWEDIDKSVPKGKSKSEVGKKSSNCV